METEEAKALFANEDIENLTFYYGEDESLSMRGKQFRQIADGRVANGVDIKGEPEEVVISPNIVHFAGKTGYGTGVRVEAHAKFTITIRGSELAKAGLRVTLTFFFENEVVLGYTFDATSIWKTWYLPDYFVGFPELSRSGYRFLGWKDANGRTVTAAEPPRCEGPTTYTAMWEKLPATLTVRCQVKVKSWGMTYSWNTIRIETLTFDAYKAKISDVLARIDLAGYTFSPDYSAWKQDDTVTIAEDGSTMITLRFTAG